MTKSTGNKKLRPGLKARIAPYKSPLVIVSLLFLVIECFTLLFGLYWAIITSLKSINNFAEDVFGFPWDLKFNNYSMVYKRLYYQIVNEAGYKRIYFPGLFLNSILYATIPEFVGILTFASVSYVVSKFRFAFNKVMTTIVLFVMICPQMGSIGSTITFLRSIGFYDNYYALLYGKIIFADYAFLIWMGTWKGVPSEYMEAAKMDGAGNLRTMLLIMFPLAKVTFAIYVVLGFISAWNNYSIPLITMPSMPNLALALYQFQENSINEISWPTYQMAAAVIVAIPSLVLYCIIEPYLVGNLTMGGIKG